MKLPKALIFVLPPSHQGEWVTRRYKALMRRLMHEIRILTGINDACIFSMHAATNEFHSDIAADAMASEIAVTQFKRNCTELTQGNLTIDRMLDGVPEDKISIFVTPWAWRYASMIIKAEALKDGAEYTEPPVFSDGTEGIGQALIILPDLKFYKLVSI